MELIDRQAALKLAKDICVPVNGTEYRHRSIDPDALLELPTIDAVQVVRCKDCVYHKDDNVDHWCEHKFVTFEGVCKNGKRREDDGKENTD